jgi:hypothetical protein
MSAPKAAARVAVMPEAVAGKSVAVAVTAEVARQTSSRSQRASMRGEMAMPGEMSAAKPAAVMALRKVMIAKVVTPGEVMATEMVTSREAMPEVPATEMAKMAASEMSPTEVAPSKMSATEVTTTTEMMTATEMVTATEMSGFSRNGIGKRIEGDERHAQGDRQAQGAKHFLAPI